MALSDDERAAVGLICDAAHEVWLAASLIADATRDISRAVSIEPGQPLTQEQKDMVESLEAMRRGDKR